MALRAIQFTQQGTVELCEISPGKQSLGPREVRIKNLHSIISPGTELACLAGIESWFKRPGIPGYGSVGEVLEKGSEVGWVSVGDKVLTHGPHAEEYVVDTTHRTTGMCLRLPDGLDPAWAPFARMATFPFTAIRVSDIELGDSVAVLGLGLIGNFAAQLATLQGANVIGIDIDGNRRALAQNCGIAHTVDSSQSNWKESLAELCGARALTTVIDATGLSRVLVEAAGLVKEYGEVILLGSPRVSFETNITPVFNHIHLPKFVNFKGALEWRYPTFPDPFVKHSVIRNSDIVMNLIRDKRLHIEPLLTHRVTPDKAPDAYAGLKDNKDSYLGVIIDWTNPVNHP